MPPAKRFRMARRFQERTYHNLKSCSMMETDLKQKPASRKLSPISPSLIKHFRPVAGCHLRKGPRRSTRSVGFCGHLWGGRAESLDSTDAHQSLSLGRVEALRFKASWRILNTTLTPCLTPKLALNLKCFGYVLRFG